MTSAHTSARKTRSCLAGAFLALEAIDRQQDRAMSVAIAAHATCNEESLIQQRLFEVIEDITSDTSGLQELRERLEELARHGGMEVDPS